jgi:acyl-CoA thioesterase-1
MRLSIRFWMQLSVNTMPVRLIVVFLLALMPAAHAATVHIVALGASNTAGYGVSREQSFPAQLQSMLQAHGHDVVIENAGISGDTAERMLARLSAAVPEGTRVVVLDPGNNDIKACSEPSRPQKCATPAGHAASITAIVRRLRTRGVAVVMANITFRSIPIADWQADRRHMTPDGHRIIASRLVAQVASAISKR